MNNIIKKEQLSDKTFRLTVDAPLIAKERKAGQFIILQINNDFGERIPLTIADANKKQGTISLIFQTVGKTTHLLSKLRAGDTISNLVGPLGKPTHIEMFGHVICIGGGIGAAPLYPIVQAMKDEGNQITTILGAKTKDVLILQEEMQNISDNLIICTDDGSLGRKGLVTAPLKEICQEAQRPNLVVAIGPPIMMKFCAKETLPFHIPTVVSLNTIMVDGTGMCGGCRVSVGNETKFVCVDGPEFDGHLVDFDNMIKRLNSYKKYEEEAYHKCRLDIQRKNEEVD